MAKVFLTRSSPLLDPVKAREEAIKQVLDMVGVGFDSGKRLLIKPNLNDGWPYPATTDPETLRVLCDWLFQRVPVDQIVLGDGSSMNSPDSLNHYTYYNMERRGYFQLPLKHFAYFEEEEPMTLVVDGEPLTYPKTVTEVPQIIYVPTLKTHSVIAAWSFALKNTVGATTYATRRWMHAEAQKYFSKRVIQINLPIKVDLVLADCSKMFIEGGASYGKECESNVFLSSTDRFAADLVGASILLYHGAVFKIGGQLVTQRVLETPEVLWAMKYGLGKPSDVVLESTFEDGLTDFIRKELAL